MKKFLSILLIAVMLLAAFTACTTDNSDKEKETKNTTQGSTEEKNENNPTESGEENTGNNTNSNTNNTTNNNTTNNSSNAQTNEEKYNSACSLISQKKYTEAYTLLKSIKSYEPAQEKLKNFFYAPEKIYEEWVYADDNITGNNATEYVYDQMGNILQTSDDYVFTYDENGNVLSGVDLIYGDPFYTYTYKDGKLYQMKTSYHSITYTYTYNADGSIESMQSESDVGGDIYFYEYTYYASGKIKTMKYDHYLYYYDESGRITQVDMLNYDGESEMTGKATYGEFGITKLIIEIPGYSIANYTYSYDTDGKLTSLLVKNYQDGKLYSTHTLEYAKHQLYYSENPSVQARLAQITCTDFEAAAEIVW